MLRVAVLASGRGSNLAALQTHGAQAGFGVVGVFSDKPEAGALQYARDAGIHAQAVVPGHYEDRSRFDLALFDAVMELRPELIVCAGYMRIISAPALARMPVPMINIHPSLLPLYPGLNTHARALAAGDAEHGASVHLVTPELDGGPVIAQARVAVEPDDDPPRLAARVLEREHRLLPACVALFASGRLTLHQGQPWLDGEPLTAPLQLRGEVLVQDGPVE